MKKGTIFLVFVCLFNSAFAQDSSWESRQFSQDELNNISILSECYGYVRFFYPNPHTKDIDWMRFLMKAIAKIEKTTNDDDLKSRLLELFSPVCPQISFSTDSMISTEKLTPPYYAIEHKAIGTLSTRVLGRKYSPIVKITDDIDYQKMYSYKLRENLYVNFPVAVKQLPAKTKEFSSLKKELNKIDKRNISLFTALINRKKIGKSNFLWEQSGFRIADVIVRRNYVRHFYPYFSEDGLDENWDLECLKTAERIAKINDIDNYYLSICRLLGNIKDSHVNIWSDYKYGKYVGGYINQYYPDVSLSVVNDTCFVDFVGKEYENVIKKGNIVRSIHTFPIDGIIQNKLLEVPHSTTSNGLHIMSLKGKLLGFRGKTSVDMITISQDNIETTTQLNANLTKTPYLSNNIFFRLLDNDVVYINLCSDSCTYKNFVNKIPAIQDSKGVIFDMRGYPRYDVLSIISHFIKDKIELGNIIRPFYCFPNQEKVKYMPSEKWYVYPAFLPESKWASKKYEYKKPLPIQIEKPIVFLIDGKNMSFGETFAEMMKFHKVGTLVGTHTAGCNGDLTQLSMPCFTFFMTYYKVLNRDGSQHHGIGVLPDVHCEMLLSDIRNNIDTQLEKAKELLR